MTELEDMEEIVGNFAAAHDLYFKTMEKAHSKAWTEREKIESAFTEAKHVYHEGIIKIKAELYETDTKATTALAKIIAKEKR